MNKLNKAIAGTAAAAALTVAGAAPAQARDHDGIGAGEVIAGAVVLGGLAAILASSGKKDRYDNYDRRYRDRDYRDGYGYNGYRGISSRAAVQRCVAAAENRASRRYGWANVTEIDDIDRTRNGFRIKGDIVVDDGRRGRGYRNRYDRGEFTCRIDGRGHARVSFDDLNRGRRW